MKDRLVGPLVTLEVSVRCDVVNMKILRRGWVFVSYGVRLTEYVWVISHFLLRCASFMRRYVMTGFVVPKGENTDRSYFFFFHFLPFPSTDVEPDPEYHETGK